MARAIPELIDYAARWPGTVALADDAATFADLLARAVSESDNAARRRRIAAAHANGWTPRLEEMSALIEQAEASR